MFSITSKLKQVRRPVWIGVLVLFVAINIIVVSSQILYNRTVDLLTENLRERILTISITAAANIDANDLDVLNVEADASKPEWERVVTTLHKAKYSNEDVVFMYIFRKLKNDPSEMEFIADADSVDPYANTDQTASNDVDVNRDGVIEPDGPDKLQWPGQLYPEAVDIPEAFAAYDGPLTSADLYTDEYGTVLTGYAPIVDENGEVAAILATDIQADDFFNITTQTLQPFIIFIVFLTSIITILTGVIMYTSRKYSKTLEESSKKLASANKRLKILDQMKSEFVSIASHQLRSPLTSIRGYASMLLEGTYGKLPEKSQEAIEKISESSRFMALSVEDYLNVSRIQSGKMKYETSDFNLKDLAFTLVDDMRREAMRKGLVLKAESSLEHKGIVHADIGKTRQVIQNLIDNAMKYTPKGTITLTVRDQKRPKKIFVEVSDTGIGMDPETIETLFDKFERAHNANDVNVTGTGLGLYIARKMAEDMGGAVTAKSEGEGKGSVFSIELPLQM